MPVNTVKVVISEILRVIAKGIVLASVGKGFAHGFIGDNSCAHVLPPPITILYHIYFFVSSNIFIKSYGHHHFNMLKSYIVKEHRH